MINSLCLNCKWRHIDCSGSDDENFESGIDYKNYDCYELDDSEEDYFDPSEEEDREMLECPVCRLINYENELFNQCDRVSFKKVKKALDIFIAQIKGGLSYDSLSNCDYDSFMYFFDTMENELCKLRGLVKDAMK